MPTRQAKRKLTQILESANAVADVFNDFKPFAVFDRNGIRAKLCNIHAKDLTMEQQNQIHALFEANMKTLYQQSDWGYDPKAKRGELFEDEARYLLAYDSSSPFGAGKGPNDQQLLGFVHFRFVEEDELPVLYIFEIQVASCAQRKGIGKFLMQILLLVARKYQMQLVMLTVFKQNGHAMRFYQDKLGFEIDETSPSQCGDPSQSYEILSKDLGPK